MSTSVLLGVLGVLDVVVGAYLLAYFTISCGFIVTSFRQVRRRLVREHLRPPDRDEHNPYLPPLTLLVPAYNEEITCVQSVHSLLQLRYPHYEIVICNDGSTDQTVDVLREAFGFERADVDYNPELQTAPVRGLYRAGCALPPTVTRLVLIDKANDGKADALNACINAAAGVFVASMDADSVLEPTALLRIMQAVADDPNRTVAVGTQVGVANGSPIEHGELRELRLPPSWLARFQVAEYMRSFTQGRVALSEVDSLLILSGVFALMRRDLVVAAGGFLTKRVSGRVVNEYCGRGAQTVCEDMEIIVRLQRYLTDRNRAGRVAFDPYPAAWTEVPESIVDLGKQRGRWYRGLLEVLWYHRGVLLNPRHGRTGLFALPYQLVCEALAPIIEAIGYAVVPLTVITGLLAPEVALALLAATTGLHMLVSTTAILISVYERDAGTPRGRALFSYRRTRDVAALLLASFAMNIGYRQYLLWWQLKGLRDFLRGRKQWDKFARKGFEPAPRAVSTEK